MAGDGPVGYGLLSRDRTFADLLPAYLLPYAAYVGLGALTGAIGPDAVVLARFVAVAWLLWHFRARYRFGPPLTLRPVLIAIAASAGALALWILAYRFSLALPWWRGHLAGAEAAEPSAFYWIGRTVNSALLVPVFEEGFCRAWLGELLFGLGMRSGPGGFPARLGERMDSHPVPLSSPPLSAISVLGCTVLFSLGHAPSAWIAAALYFLFTSWIYAMTGSFRVCLVVHGLVNLAIAGLAYGMPGMRFLWF
ncbi:MAG: hypothetical protein JWP91_4333 [Fibrobacteres bacterium]|nr:hypothetical protein [Fibrobacterota bacterium]